MEQKMTCHCLEIKLMCQTNSSSHGGPKLQLRKLLKWSHTLTRVEVVTTSTPWGATTSNDIVFLKLYIYGLFFDLLLELVDFCWFLWPFKNSYQLGTRFTGGFIYSRIIYSHSTFYKGTFFSIALFKMYSTYKTHLSIIFK